jgi:hypothetical protein
VSVCQFVCVCVVGVLKRERERKCDRYVCVCRLMKGAIQIISDTQGEGEGTGQYRQMTPGEGGGSD